MTWSSPSGHFWLVDQSGEDLSHIKDCGLEGITKDGFPLTKWRQYSDYSRWNAPEPGPGTLAIHKRLITPYNLVESHIQMNAVVGGAFGFTLNGTIKVTCGD